MNKKRNYTKEFKIQACELVLKESLKVKSVADRMGINQVMLYRWIDEYRTYGESAFIGKGKLRPEDAKLKKLQKENEELRQQVEILKKQRHTLRKKTKTVRFRKKRVVRIRHRYSMPDHTGVEKRILQPQTKG